MDEITVVLCLWKRQKNFLEILQGILDNTPSPNIIIWNNGEPIPNEHIHNDVLDIYNIRYINSSENVGSQAKIHAGLLAKTKYVFFQDDDLKISPHTIQTFYDVIKRHPMSVVALKEGIIDEEGNYIGSSYSMKEKPIKYTVGRIMMVDKDFLGEYFRERYENLVEIGEEDLCLGFVTMKLTGEPSYIVPIQRCTPIELPANDGKCNRKNHYKYRTETIRYIKPLLEGVIE